MPLMLWLQLRLRLRLRLSLVLARVQERELLVVVALLAVVMELAWARLRMLLEYLSHVLAVWLLQCGPCRCTACCWRATRLTSGRGASARPCRLPQLRIRPLL